MAAPYNETETRHTGSLDVGDRGVDLECPGDGLAALGAQLVVPEAAKSDP